MKNALSAAALAPALLVGSAVVAHGDTASRFWHGMPNGGHMMLGGLAMLLFWTVILVISVVVVRWFVDRNRTSSAERQQTPLQTLEERFARGEIDQQEFEQRRQVLRGS